MNTISPFNKFLVSMHDDLLSVMRAPTRMNRDDALELAAWLVAMADVLPGEHTFEDYLKAVRAS